MIALLTIIKRFTVIDEADELLSTGWEEAMEKLFQGSGMLAFANINLYSLLLDSSSPSSANNLSRPELGC